MVTWEGSVPDNDEECGHMGLIASGEARGLCPLCQRERIEVLEAQNEALRRALAPFAHHYAAVTLGKAGWRVLLEDWQRAFTHHYVCFGPNKEDV